MLLGATFNRSLWREIGTVISNEARALYNQGISGLFYFAPNINLFRDPRWGRGQEVPGEDPYLSGQYGIEYVKSMQSGQDPRYLKVATVAKHFADYDVEGNVAPATPRKSFDAIVSEQDQVNYYWAPWRMVVENTELQGIMCSYSSVNGLPNCANEQWLNGIVRGQWFFDGVIFSDGGGISDDAFTQYINETYGGLNPQQQCRTALDAGCDVDLGNYFALHLTSAVQSGLVTEKDLDVAVSRLFTRSFRLGKFDFASPPFYNTFGPEYVDSPFNRRVAQTAAEQGIVLLKNADNILPIRMNASSKLKLAFIGPHLNITQRMLGSYRGANTLVDSHSPLQAMQRYIADNGLSEQISLQYAEACDIVCNDTSDFADAVSMAKDNDVVIVFLGLYAVQYSDEVPYGNIYDAARESEGCDRTNLTFPNEQLSLLQQLSAVNGHIVLVLFNSSPIDLSWPKANVPGIIQCFYPGELGGDALVNILMGQISPSGKLPITVYSNEFVQNREIENMDLSADGGITYRYFEGEAVYNFSHGLYYTNFSFDYVDDGERVKFVSTEEMADLWAQPRGVGDVSFVVTVTNVGAMASDCVVTGFVRNEEREDGQPQIALFDFEKVFVRKGESVNVTLSVSPYAMTSVDKRGHERVVSGAYEVLVGDYMNGNYVGFQLVLQGQEQTVTHLPLTK